MKVPLSQLKISVNLDQSPKAGTYQETLKLSAHITKNPWSPIIFRGNKRLETNFMFSDWAVLDYENGTTIEEAIKTFCDCIHIIGTTKSHTPEAHRFRVCIPWEQRINSLHLFKHNQRVMIEYYDTDPQCKDGARFYFPCKEIISVSTEGFRMSVKEPPPVLDKRREVQNVGLSSCVTFFMRNTIVQGKRNFQIYQVAKDLFRIGMSKIVVEEFVVKSPTYRDSVVEGELLSEIRQTINSAWRSVHNESGQE